MVLPSSDLVPRGSIGNITRTGYTHQVRLNPISSFNENECMATGTATSGPSTGTVVGIAIGVIAAIAVATAIVIIIFLRHKNHRATLKMTDTRYSKLYNNRYGYWSGSRILFSEL